MKDDKTERLIKKYKEGQSTLSEEQFLFSSTENIEPSLDAWSTFVKNNKMEIPESFNDDLWKSFQNRKNRKRKLFIGILSAAASIVLFASLFLFNSKQGEMDYAEKAAMLSLAKEMVSNSDATENNETIIYENDMVIIYMTKD